MHQLKKELALQETVWRDGEKGRKKREQKERNLQDERRNKDTSHANWWTHVCLCFPELNCFNTVSKCVGVHNALLCSPALESICQCPAALHLWAECLQGFRPAGTEVGWRVVSLRTYTDKRPWAWRGQVIITEISHTPASTKRQVIRMNRKTRV